MGWFTKHYQRLPCATGAQGIPEPPRFSRRVMTFGVVDAITRELDALSPCNEASSSNGTAASAKHFYAEQETDEADMIFNVGGHGKRAANLAVRVVDDGAHISKASAP